MKLKGLVCIQLVCASILLGYVYHGETCFENFVICFSVNLILFLVEANPHAKRLYDDLLSNYNRLIRPVSNNSEKLTVNLGLKLSQLIDVVRNYL